MENLETTPQTVEPTADHVASATEQTVEPPSDNEETAKLRAEVKRLKAANDNLAKENAEKTKTIRSYKSAEEQQAEEAKERQEAIEKELNELRKKSAVSEISKRVMAFVGDEAVSNTAAESLYGASDIEAALDVLQKAWVAREKKLRMEFGKIPAPGAGSDEPTITKEQLSAMSYSERAQFAYEHPELYEKLTN